MSAMLQASGLSVSFGRLAVLDGVDLHLERGARHALIGPNGAGKTTLVNALAGALIPDRGSVWLDGRDVTDLDAAARARRGLARTFQVMRLFPELTPQMSVTMVICERDGLGRRWWTPLRRLTGVQDEALHWLNRLGLACVANVPVANLDYGQQRLLDIALALACRPRVLLLDEPAAGLPLRQRHAMLDVIRELPGDISVLLIEHDMNLVFGFARSVSVLAQGRVIASGSPDQIRADPDVRAVYLGKLPATGLPASVQPLGRRNNSGSGPTRPSG